MEALSSFKCNLTPNPHPNAPPFSLLPFNHPPPRIHNNKNDTFSLGVSATPLFPITSSQQKPKRFKEQNAFPNSIPIHNKNPHAIYKDIQKFSHQNKLKEALAIMDYLDHRGIPVNITTFSALIAACGRVQSIEAAKTVHIHIRINGLEENEFLQTKLVQMYSSCGSVEDAKKLFDKMPVKSVHPWNALLRGNVVLGRRNYREMWDSFMEMRASGVELNVYSFSCLIKSLAGACAFRQGLKTHGILIKNGFSESSIVKTSLIDMYFKCGKIKLACILFEEVGERDVVVWGAMIAGFAHNKLQREALEYTRLMVSEGVEVNSVILTTILPVIGEIVARKIGKEAHAYVIKTKGYSKHLFIQSALIDMYCKCGDMVSARAVFYGSMERNTISWTALISGYVATGRLEQALRSIVWMQQEGFKPDIVTIATVLPVCAKLKVLKQGKELHAFAIKNGFSSGVSIATSLMVMYSKCNTLHYCARVFENMESKNVISWTAMIECYIECEYLDEALSVFRLMQLSKHRPDSVTIARILNICGDLKVEKFGKEIHAHALRKKFDSVPSVCAEIVKMYGKFGNINKAMCVFDAVPVKGSITWTAIIEAHGCYGQYEEALRLFERMVSDEFVPNQFTFKVILRMCEQAGFVEDALRLFTLMTQKYNLKASEEHYSCMVDLFSRLGRTKEADKFRELRSSLS